MAALGGRTRTLNQAAISAASSGNNTLVAAVTGKKIVVISYAMVADAAVAARFDDAAGGTALSGAMSFAANGGISATGNPMSPLFWTTAGNALVINLGGAVGVRGHLTYTLE